MLLHGELTEAQSIEVVAQLLYLESLDSVGRIELYVDSPGGKLVDAYAIVSAIAELSCPVARICLRAFGAALMVGVFGASAEDRLIAVDGHVGFGWTSDVHERGRVEVQELKERMLRDWIAATGRRRTALVRDIAHSRVFLAEEAVSYGLHSRAVPVFRSIHWG